MFKDQTPPEQRADTTATDAKPVGSVDASQDVDDRKRQLANARRILQQAQDSGQVNPESVQALTE